VKASTVLTPLIAAFGTAPRLRYVNRSTRLKDGLSVAQTSISASFIFTNCNLNNIRHHKEGRYQAAA
jgi:hypothetical protein